MYCESCNAVYFERFSVVLGHFLKASYAKHLLVTKSSFLRRRAFENELWSLEFSTSQKLTESSTTQYPYGTHL